MLTKLKKYKTESICICFLLFPIIVGLLYALPFPQVIKVESGDLLGYYAQPLVFWVPFTPTARKSVNPKWNTSVNSGLA